MPSAPPAAISLEISVSSMDILSFNSRISRCAVLVPTPGAFDIALASPDIMGLYTYTYVKEDAFLLYGFLSRSDLEMFKLCITVSGAVDIDHRVIYRNIFQKAIYICKHVC